MRFLSVYKSKEKGVPPTQQEMERMGRRVEEGMRSGYLLSTEGCLPSSMGARVRLDHGQWNVTDGPFTESKEVIGGFAIIQADSREQAVERIKEFLQVVGEGECELRQLYDGGPAAS